MALSNFAATAPNLAQYSALSELKPLSFAGGMQSPLEFRTMSAIRPPDAQPEAVAQGIGKALGSVAEGITAAFKSKAEEKKDQLKFQRDKELARIKSADSDARLDESERHNRAMEAAALARVKEVTSLDFGNTSYKGSEESTPPPAEPKSQAPEEPVRFFGSDPETKYMGRDANVTPEGVPLSMTEEQTKALSGLTPDISERSNRGMLTAGLSGALPYTGLSDLDAGKIFAQYNVSSSPLGIPNSAPIQKAYDLMLDEYRQDALTNTLAEQKQFGTLPPPELATPKSETPALSDLKPVGEKVPRSTFDSYPEAQKYMEDQAGNPDWYASGTPEPNKQGKFVIPWKQNDPELRASRKARESQQADFGKGRLDLRKKNLEIQTFNQSVDKFSQDPSIKKVKEKLKPVIETFMGDLTELNRMGDKYGNRSILDQSLIDQYVRFATGNVPTHNQYEMLTENRPLFDKLKTYAFKKVPASSTSLLTDLERKQMANSMVKVLNMEHEGLNTKVENSRRIVDKLKNTAIDENNKPHKFPILKTDEDVEKEVSMAVKEMEKAWGDANSKTAKDPEAYKLAIQKHKKALADYEIAKKGVPSNLDDLAKYGEEIDGTYYPAGWSGRLIYEDETAYRPFQNAPVPNGNGE